MTRDELHGLITTHLDRDGDAERWSEKPGAVLYSDIASIRRGRFYLMGTNPGGREDQAPEPIAKTLCALDGTNNFVDECWTHSPSPCEHLDPATGHLWPDARKHMQMRICDLFDALGKPPHDVLSTNLVFARSPTFDVLPNPGDWVRRCWPVHQALLKVVQPDWIIMLGYGRAYDLFCKKGMTIGEPAAIGAGHPAAWHRRMTLDIGADSPLETDILAVRHPSDFGFFRAGFGNVDRYPDELKAFIAEKVFSRPKGDRA